MCNARDWKNETFTFKDVCYKKQQGVLCWG